MATDELLNKEVSRTFGNPKEVKEFLETTNLFELYSKALFKYDDSPGLIIDQEFSIGDYLLLQSGIRKEITLHFNRSKTGNLNTTKSLNIENWKAKGLIESELNCAIGSFDKKILKTGSSSVVSERTWTYELGRYRSYQHFIYVYFEITVSNKELEKKEELLELLTKRLSEKV